jgi:hypothetical protein
MKKSLALLAVLSLCLQGSGCREVSAASGYPSRGNGPRTYLFIVDVSASRTQKSLEEDKQFLYQVAQKLTYGDRVILMQMKQEGLKNDPMHGSVTMPTAADPMLPTAREGLNLTGAIRTVTSAIPQYFKSAAKVSHTDIFATLIAANDLARGGSGRPKTLVLLSDMLQSANGFEMQGLLRMPRAGWIDEQKRTGLMPQLDEACVVVVGADTTTKEGVQVLDFWKKYFSASGASLDPRDYHIYPPSLDQPLCH